MTFRHKNTQKRRKGVYLKEPREDRGRKGRKGSSESLGKRSGMERGVKN